MRLVYQLGGEGRYADVTGSRVPVAAGPVDLRYQTRPRLWAAVRWATGQVLHRLRRARVRPVAAIDRATGTGHIAITHQYWLRLRPSSGRHERPAGDAQVCRMQAASARSSNRTATVRSMVRTAFTSSQARSLLARQRHADRHALPSRVARFESRDVPQTVLTIDGAFANALRRPPIWTRSRAAARPGPDARRHREPR